VSWGHGDFALLGAALTIALTQRVSDGVTGILEAPLARPRWPLPGWAAGERPGVPASLRVELPSLPRTELTRRPRTPQLGAAAVPRAGLALWQPLPQ